jgi:lysozyme family protein
MRGHCDSARSVSRRAASEGGAQFGITLEELRIARNDKSLTADDLSKLTRDQAREIYRARYWNVLNCDDLPVGVDLVTFDFGVEVGPTEAARVLQAVVGAGADGSIGPATVAAAKAMPPRDFITTMTKRRLEYYRKQSDWAEAGEYRTDRATAVQNAALTMVTSTGGAQYQ